MSLKNAFNQFFNPLKEGFMQAFKDAGFILNIKGHYRRAANFIGQRRDRAKKHQPK